MLLIVVDRTDAPKIEGLMAGISLARIGPDGADDGLEVDGRKMALAEAQAHVVASAFCSPEGKAATGRFETAFAAQTALDTPPSIDLSGLAAEGLRAMLADRLVAILAAGTGAQARRNAMLHRDIAELRRQHDRMQASFAALEKFVHDSGMNHRRKTFELSPAANVAPVVLAPGLSLEQRLPRTSSGLSDVAIFIDEADAPESGGLTATLLTAEDERVHAVWSVDGKALKAGWLRLALPAALEDDPRTLILRLEWEGSDGLGLGWSLHHPDPRFNAVIDGESTGRTLALCGWYFIAGCEAPAAGDAILPTGRKPPRERVISSAMLARAENLNPACTNFQYIADSKALLVHVVAGGESIARLSASVPEGTSRIACRIMTRHEKAPAIEYALAIARSPEDPSRHHGIPRFATESMTPWVRLEALEEGDLNLDLPAALEATHDLYLMTRPGKGVQDISWGWSTFSAIRMPA